MKQLDVKVTIPMSKLGFVLWILALFTILSAGVFAANGNWAGFAMMALWAVCLTVRSLAI